MIKMCINLYVKYLLFLPDINETPWTNFLKIFKNQNSYKSVQWNCPRSASRRTDRGTDRQTDMTMLKVAFLSFTKNS